MLNLMMEYSRPSVTKEQDLPELFGWIVEGVECAVLIGFVSCSNEGQGFNAAAPEDSIS
jgi:hypothetical protein